MLPDFLDSVVGASLLGDGRSALGFDERDDIMWVIIVRNKVY